MKLPSPVAGHSCSRSLCTYSPSGCMQDLPLFVDNTFAPLLVSPALWGADVVLTSLTKYFGGGADVIAGAGTSCKSPPPYPKHGQGVCLECAHVTQRSSAFVESMSVRCLPRRGCRRERNHQADSVAAGRAQTCPCEIRVLQIEKRQSGQLLNMSRPGVSGGGGVQAQCAPAGHSSTS